MLFPAACENAPAPIKQMHGGGGGRGGLTGENEDLQSFERGDGFSQLPHHVAVYVMAPEVQQDDVVLGGSLQPAHELPQLLRPQLPEAWCEAFVLEFPVRPAVGI